MSRYRFLTFDCYGTLIDWRTGIAEHLGDILRRHGVDPAPEELLQVYVEEEHRLESGPYRRYREILAESARAVASRFDVRISDEEARAFADSLPDWPPFPDTVDGLKAFGVMGFRRVILSNVDRDLLAKTIRRHGLEVDGAITAEDTRTYKPNPRHWLAFCSRYAVRREEVLHIAQSLLELPFRGGQAHRRRAPQERGAWRSATSLLTLQEREFFDARPGENPTAGDRGPGALPDRVRRHRSAIPPPGHADADFNAHAGPDPHALHLADRVAPCASDRGS